MSKQTDKRTHTVTCDYTCQDENFDSVLMYLRKTQTSIVNFGVNRMFKTGKKFSKAKLENIVKTDMNNIKDKPGLSFHVRSAVYEALAEYDGHIASKEEWETSRDEKIKKKTEKFEHKKISENTYYKELKRLNEPYSFIRGGKQNFIKRCKGEITHEEYVRNKVLPYCSIGEGNQGGNRYFVLYDDFTVLFKPFANSHFNLKLKVYKADVEKYKKLVELQNSEDEEIAITYKLDWKTIHITFEARKELFPEFDNKSANNPIANRWLSVDSNPNYIGWSVVQWKGSGLLDIIDYGVYDLKEFSDKWNELNKLGDVKSDDPRRKEITNKRKYEISQIAIHLSNVAVHYRCTGIAVEDLDMPAKDKQKGKDYNYLCNCAWIRNDFFYMLDKMCYWNKLMFQKVNAAFSSTAGNFLFRHYKTPDGISYLPDMVCASIEISRRAYEYTSQYEFKTKDIKKNIVNFDIQDFQEMYVKSLEEFGMEEMKGLNISKIHYELKASECKVRVLLEDSYLYKSSDKNRFFPINKSHVRVYRKPTDKHIINKRNGKIT